MDRRFWDKFAKTCGSTFNDVARGLSHSVHLFASSTLFVFIIALWLVTAFFLGKRFDKAIERNEVIGK